MASLPQLPRPSKFAGVLQYFDKYDYPLTRQEQIYWWSPSGATVGSFASAKGFFFLPGRQKIVELRKQRQKISVKKWQIAKEIGEKLKKFSFIQAVFVTGSLAMNNTPESDDIDLMLVTSANALWLTRFFVNIYLSSVRRYPHQKQVANVVCVNLWLDENNLAITPHNLYTAHEIVQAKTLWDRGNISQRFLVVNPWVKEYLPNAYKLSAVPISKFSALNFLLWPINLFFFIGQYLYMLPKKTNERVALGSAFFHPRKSD